MKNQLDMGNVLFKSLTKDDDIIKVDSTDLPLQVPKYLVDR